MSKLNLKQREARDVEWEGPQGRELKRIQDSGERMKSICFPPSADRLAMLDSSRPARREDGNDALAGRLALNILFPQAIKPGSRVPFSWSR